MENRKCLHNDTCKTKWWRSIDCFSLHGTDDKQHLFSLLEYATRVINNDSKFAVSIDVSKFKPEHLKVNIEGRQLTIEGKEEVKEENGYSMTSFVRQWDLPENVDLDAVRSSLSESGRLCIEAPKIGRAADSGRTIPIHRVTDAEKTLKNIEADKTENK
ncbi:Hsp20/alpha crystallin family protein [Teladorsagia circumcincta]|uniref:Hsp20/alpha crystallin family protein n=1 Tax=Teladorsagia circumcincta TaxID=45464 RepID=A0A2G9UW56_TELCI|nr:Hsp20/alpha crystallin family protein [Teladorsagia circumcincta]